MKVALTINSPFSGTTSVQVAVPLQAPEKPVNLKPVLATGISVTVEPTGKIARQIPPLMVFVMVQASPPGELETEPLPVPAPLLTVIAPGTARRYCACTTREEDSGTMQLPVPLQAPPHVTKTLPGVGDWATDTLVLSA